MKVSQPGDNKKRNKNILIAFGVCALALLLWGRFGGRDEKEVMQKQTPTGKITDSVVFKPVKYSDSGSVINSNINKQSFISKKRSYLLSKIESLNPDIKMEQANLKDDERFLGTDKQNMVEIIGTEDQVKSVTWILGFSDNNDSNIVAAIEMYGLINDISDDTAGDWVTKKIKKIERHPKRELKDSTIVNNIKINMSYSHELPAVTLILTQAN